MIYKICGGTENLKTYQVGGRFRHEKEDGAKDEGQNATNDAQPEYFHTSSDGIDEQDTNGYHQLEEAAQRSANLLLSNLTRVHGSSHTESSTGDTEDEA